MQFHGLAYRSGERPMLQPPKAFFPRGLPITVLPLLTVVLPLLAADPQRNAIAADLDGFRATVVPFFQQHCIQCHGPDQQKGKLALHAIDGNVPTGKDIENMLDFLLDDIQRLEKQVGSGEKEKLGQHLAAYEAMRDRQSRLNEIESTLRKHAPVVSNKYTSTVETDRLDAMFDIGAAALIGGLTNVVTLASGVGNPFFGVKFGGLGIGIGKHGIGHGGSFNGMTWDVMSTTIRRFHFELIARLMKKLEGVQEGDGTMLDNTLIVYLSDAAEGHHSRCWEWPFVMVGNLGGKIKSGRYVDYPYWGKKGHREIGNLYTTLLHAVGDRRDYFGLRDPMLKGDAGGNGPLSELLG